MSEISVCDRCGKRGPAPGEKGREDEMGSWGTIRIESRDGLRTMHVHVVGGPDTGVDICDECMLSAFEWFRRNPSRM